MKRKVGINLGKYDSLFRPLTIGKMMVKNRFAMAPMSLGLTRDGGYVTQKTVDYFAERAKGEVGLIITDATQVDSRYKTATFIDPEFTTEAHMKGHSQLTKAVHEYGAKIVPELAHAGPFSAIDPIGPSDTIDPVSGNRIRGVSAGEMDGIINKYGEAAEKAKLAGYDGVALHMAHALMLLGSFLSPMRNKRTDAYGGNLEGRMKLPLEVIARIKKKCGDDFPILVRMSGDEIMDDGNHLMDAVCMAQKFEEAGVDALEISGGASPEYLHWCIPLLGTKHGLNAGFSEHMKKHVNIPVLTVGRITLPEYAASIIDTKKADMVVLGRALLADPEFVKKTKEGRVDEINQCAGCGDGCSAANFEIPGCAINPRAGNEAKLNIQPTAHRRKVVVVGGGMAGMQAASDAAARGHEVTLFEKSDILGGVVNFGKQPPLKQELVYFIQSLERQVKRTNVDLRMNTQVTKDIILALQPDTVIIATGSTPVWPKVEGLNKDNAVTALDVLGYKTSLKGKRYLVVGGGLVGLETADFILQNNEYAYLSGRDIHVTVIEMLPELARECVPQNRYYRMARLKRYNAKIHVSTKLVKVAEDGVYVDEAGEVKNFGHFDGIVVACGMRPQNELAEALEGTGVDIKVIGDAVKPRQVLYATREGAMAAAELG